MPRSIDEIMQDHADRVQRLAEETKRRQRLAYSPLAERIMVNNSRTRFSGGMEGAGEMFLSFLSPGMHKRHAAAAIIALRQLRQHNIQHGRNPNAGTEEWFERAQHNRRQAQRLAQMEVEQ